MDVEIKKIQLIRLLKELLVKHFGNKIKEVILFGSQIKGAATEFSDYDVLILLRCDYDWKFRDQVTDTIYDIELEKDIIFDQHLLSENELINSPRGFEPIYQNAIKNGLYA
jgi:predicted nucleotidyltransferase